MLTIAVAVATAATAATAEAKAMQTCYCRTMVPGGFIFTILRTADLTKLIMAVLFAALFMIADAGVLLFLAAYVDAPALLTIAASTGPLLLVVMVPSFSRHRRAMRAAMAGGRFPQREIKHLVGIGCALLLVLLPGFVTDALGIACYLPPIRLLIGSVATRFNKQALMSAYQHLQAE